MFRKYFPRTMQEVEAYQLAIVDREKKKASRPPKKIKKVFSRVSVRGGAKKIVKITPFSSRYKDIKKRVKRNF